MVDCGPRKRLQRTSSASKCVNRRVPIREFDCSGRGLKPASTLLPSKIDPDPIYETNAHDGWGHLPRNITGGSELLQLSFYGRSLPPSINISALSFEELAPLFPSPPSPFFPLMDQHIIRPSDWAETFQYLSREVLSPEAFATEMLQQVPTPPVRSGPLPRIFAAALTLLLSGAATGLGYPLPLSRRDHNRCLRLHRLLPRGRAGPTTPSRSDSTYVRLGLLLCSYHGAPSALEKLIQLPPSTLPVLPGLRRWLTADDQRTRG